MYVGAACPNHLKHRLLASLSLGGILIAPVEDEVTHMHVDIGILAINVFEYLIYIYIYICVCVSW
jgi:hypothetical protein